MHEIQNYIPKSDVLHRSDRLLFIHWHFLWRGEVSTKDVTIKFGVTRQTVLQDLKEYRSQTATRIEYQHKRGTYVLIGIAENNSDFVNRYVNNEYLYTEGYAGKLCDYFVEWYFTDTHYALHPVSMRTYMLAKSAIINPSVHLRVKGLTVAKHYLDDNVHPIKLFGMNGSVYLLVCKERYYGVISLSDIKYISAELSSDTDPVVAGHSSLDHLQKIRLPDNIETAIPAYAASVALSNGWGYPKIESEHLD